MDDPKVIYIFRGGEVQYLDFETAESLPVWPPEGLAWSEGSIRS